MSGYYEYHEIIFYIPQYVKIYQDKPRFTIKYHGINQNTPWSTTIYKKICHNTSLQTRID